MARTVVGISLSENMTLVACNDGSIWRLRLGDDGESHYWEEFPPIPGTDRQVAKESERPQAPKA